LNGCSDFRFGGWISISEDQKNCRVTENAENFLKEEDLELISEEEQVKYVDDRDGDNGWRRAEEEEIRG
jgi:dTDP-D-glucose 4,6-dehydratase